MWLARGKIPQKCSFFCTLWAVLGSHGIVVKCTATIFLPMEDCFTISFQKCYIELRLNLPASSLFRCIIRALPD